MLVLKVRDSKRTPSDLSPCSGFHPGAMPTAFRNFVLVAVIFAIGNSSDAFLILRARQLGASTAVVIVMFALANFVNVLSAYPAGALSDRWGRKKLLLCGLLIFAAVYYGFGAAASSAALWIWFAVYGVHLGLTDGVARAFVVDLVPAEKRGAALGIHATAIGLGTLPASLLAGFIWQRFGPAQAFWFGAATALAAVTLLGLLRIERDASLPNPHS